MIRPALGVTGGLGATGCLGVTGGLLASLSPGMLPRGAVLQGLASGLCAAAGLGLALLCAALASALRGAIPKARPTLGARRSWVLCLPALAAALWLATAHQDRLRAAAAQPTIGIGYWPLAFAVAGAVVLALTGAGLLARRVSRRPMLAGALVLAGAVAAGLALPAGQGWLERRDRVLEADVAQPESGSLIPWDSVGVHGRRFLAEGAGTRVYAGLDSAPTVAARAELAAAELERAGGLDRAAVIIAVPTGSGWIDDAAVAGFERRFAGDVATVGIQYARTPSWVGYLFSPSSATESAQALASAVTRRVGAHGPQVYLYGQSLGAVGVTAVLNSDAGQRVCGGVVVGPPPGASTSPAAVVLANASDPVVRWSPRLLIAPADGEPWLPVLSFLQTSIDVLGALGLPAGSGHVYGEEQALTLPMCPRADLPEGVRTATSTVAAS